MLNIFNKYKSNLINKCPCCGSSSFIYNPVLWEELINDWGLSSSEVEYINYQQGLKCKKCQNSLRCLALSAAITYHYNYKKTLQSFCENKQF